MDVPAASSGRKAPSSASKNDTLRRRRKSDVNAEHTAVGYIEYTVMPSPREETYSIHTPRGRPRPRPRRVRAGAPRCCPAASAHT